MGVVADAKSDGVYIWVGWGHLTIQGEKGICARRVSQGFPQSLQLLRARCVTGVQLWAGQRALPVWGKRENQPRPEMLTTVRESF